MTGEPIGAWCHRNGFVSIKQLTNPQYIADRRVQKTSISWDTAQGSLTNQWVKLTFPADVIVRTERLYGAGSCAIPDTTVRLFTDQAGTQQIAQNTSGILPVTGTDVALGDVKGRAAHIDLGNLIASCNNQSSLSL